MPTQRPSLKASDPFIVRIEVAGGSGRSRPIYLQEFLDEHPDYVMAVGRTYQGVGDGHAVLRPARRKAYTSRPAAARRESQNRRRHCRRSLSVPICKQRRFSCRTSADADDRMGKGDTRPATGAGPLALSTGCLTAQWPTLTIITELPGIRIDSGKQRGSSKLPSSSFPATSTFSPLADGDLS